MAVLSPRRLYAASSRATQSMLAAGTKFGAASVRCYIRQMTDNQTQREKFDQAARELECDEDEARWDATLKKVAAQKPAPAQDEAK